MHVLSRIGMLGAFTLAMSSVAPEVARDWPYVKLTIELARDVTEPCWSSRKRAFQPQRDDGDAAPLLRCRSGIALSRQPRPHSIHVGTTGAFCCFLR